MKPGSINMLDWRDDGQIDRSTARSIAKDARHFVASFTPWNCHSNGHGTVLLEGNLVPWRKIRIYRRNNFEIG
jgi:hypothetical protein